MIRARALATTLALLLSACGTGGESPFALALTGMAASLGQSSAKARGEAALARQLTPAALARATRPLLLAELPSREARATFVIGGENRDHITWLGADGVGLVLKGGVLTATRGLGQDLLASDTVAAEAAIHRGSGDAIRGHRYLDGENRVVARSFRCAYLTEARQAIDIVGTTRATRLVSESCTAGGAAFKNRYWIGGDGTVWKSEQWIGPALGTITLTRLVP